MTAARNIFGSELQAVDYSAMPFAVFALPEVVQRAFTGQFTRGSDGHRHH